MHGEALATDACARCGTFLCGACAQRAPVGVFCGACLSRVYLETKPSRLAWTAFVLGVVGVNATLLPGLVALYLGRVELARIERGEAPPAGRLFARGAVVMGLLCAVALAAVAVYVLSRWLEAG